MGRVCSFIGRKCLILVVPNCFVFVKVISSMLPSSLLISMYLTGLNSCDSSYKLFSTTSLFLSGLKDIVLSLRFTSKRKDLDL